MNAPDSHIRWRVAAYIALWSVVSSAFACVMMPLAQQPIPTVWLDGAIFGGWYALLVPFLWNAIKYGNLLSLQSALKTIVFVALGLLTVVVWLGLSLFSLYWLLTGNLFSLLVPTIPLCAMIGILLYVIVVQMAAASYSKRMDEGNDICEENLIEPTTAVDDPKETAVLIDRVAVKIGSNIRVVPIDDILYLQSEGDYVLIITEKGKFIKEQTMKYFEQTLPPKQFVRIHRSYIVNVASISRIECYGKNKQSMILRNSMQLKMSQTGYRLLKASLNL